MEAAGLVTEEAVVDDTVGTVVDDTVEPVVEEEVTDSGGSRACHCGGCGR